jgi:hypothetical protein
MAMVLPFVPRNSASGKRPATSGKLAPVIIFPGVRYERIKADERVNNDRQELAQNPAH